MADHSVEEKRALELTEMVLGRAVQQCGPFTLTVVLGTTQRDTLAPHAISGRGGRTPRGRRVPHRPRTTGTYFNYPIYNSL
eukprot:scaffold40197_cov33-Tisochrysis_lutea.AAC.1